jgi:hypothetical protein
MRYLPPWYEMSGAQASVVPYEDHQPGFVEKASPPALNAMRSVEVR